ncbi:hypothetical protein AALO_G00199620 [Alosa alosa]|uniref:Uncharacterized protein n=1 Tax=Alosa alosa TaxID=278164 RepID=A0AAV6G5R1_9TELE|nr:hypothetical protein AALO_G00199620 [Alosa alosa]
MTSTCSCSALPHPRLPTSCTAFTTHHARYIKPCFSVHTCQIVCKPAPVTCLSWKTTLTLCL